MTPLMCLALVIYNEARGEPLDGQIAVAQVVLNRVESPLYPDDICEVINQPDQFANEPTSAPLPLQVATEALLADDFTHGGTHFYSGPDPYWADEFILIGKIGDHIFMKEIR